MAIWTRQRLVESRRTLHAVDRRTQKNNQQHTTDAWPLAKTHLQLNSKRLSRSHFKSSSTGSWRRANDQRARWSVELEFGRSLNVWYELSDWRPIWKYGSNAQCRQHLSIYSNACIEIHPTAYITTRANNVIRETVYTWMKNSYRFTIVCACWRRIPAEPLNDGWMENFSYEKDRSSALRQLDISLWIYTKKMNEWLSSRHLLRFYGIEPAVRSICWRWRNSDKFSALAFA